MAPLAFMTIDQEAGDLHEVERNFPEVVSQSPMDLHPQLYHPTLSHRQPINLQPMEFHHFRVLEKWLHPKTLCRFQDLIRLNHRIRSFRLLQGFDFPEGPMVVDCLLV